MSLSDVPEEGSPTSPISPRPLRPPRKPSNLRSISDRPSRSNLNAHISVPSISGSAQPPPNGDLRASKRNASTSSLNAVTAHHKPSSSKPPSSSSNPPVPTTPTQPKIRNTPRLPHDLDVLSSSPTIMYWSRAPVYGTVPNRGMRAHSVTIVDTVAWVFGGCDDKDCWKDVYCFDTETMQWSHPETCGDFPPPCRAHTATLVDRKIVIFGGGQGPTYYNSVYILDTQSRRWTRPKFLPPEPPPPPPPTDDANPNPNGTATPPPTPIAPPPLPPKEKPGSPAGSGDETTPAERPPTPVPIFPAPRRAHTAVHYHNKIWIFGGGNGMMALNDVWTLDVGVPMDRMRWEEVETHGRKPIPRGYHTANLVGNVMVVVGGSDGKECFSDIWCLNLDTLVWSQVKLQTIHRRLSHSATQVGSYLFIMGGHDANDYTSEILPFNLVSLQYETRPANGKAPSPRGYHAAVLADSRLFVFGGFNGHTVFDDVYLLDLAAAAYLPQVTSFKIEG